jgi:hypothetical protein
MPNFPDFPKRIPEKLKAIREHLALTPDELAPKVGARTGAEILTYENDEGRSARFCVVELFKACRMPDRSNSL